MIRWLNIYAHYRELKEYSANSLSSISTSAQQQSNLWLDNAAKYYQESMHAVITMRDIIVEQNAKVDVNKSPYVHLLTN